MPASRYTPEQCTEALKMYEAEGPSAVEKKLGIPKGTVTGWAKANGTRTVLNERTRHAVEAVRVDNKRLELLRLKVIEHLLRLAEQPVDDVLPAELLRVRLNRPLRPAPVGATSES